MTHLESHSRMMAELGLEPRALTPRPEGSAVPYLLPESEAARKEEATQGSRSPSSGQHREGRPCLHDLLTKVPETPQPTALGRQTPGTPAEAATPVRTRTVNERWRPWRERGAAGLRGRREGSPTGLTCWGMKELEKVTADQKKMPQLRITFLLKRSPR